MTAAIDLTLHSGVQRRGALRLAGLAGQFDGETRGAIPTLWDRFVPRLPVPGQAGWATYGLCWSGDLDKGFNYMAAVELAPDAPAPEGLEMMEVPAQAYAAFRLNLNGGELHPQMAAAMDEIWGRRLTEAGLKPFAGPDFEFYPEHFDPRRPGAYIEVWIPVQD